MPRLCVDFPPARVSSFYRREVEVRLRRDAEACSAHARFAVKYYFIMQPPRGKSDAER